MAISPDLPTPITPDPSDLPVEPDKGPGTPPLEQGNPAESIKLQPESASARFVANRSFLHAAAFRWPAVGVPRLTY